MHCPRCQAQNAVDARFCEDCGARLALACPQCGAEVSPGKRFCRSCGTALPGGSAAAVPVPASYTPKHLAEKILTSRSALEGERKQVTVLFADLKGSMELLADRDPEEARKLLDPVLERMMEAVHRYEGTVNQVMGDGIMALFGAPLAHEDHAVRACYAALRMQESVRLYAETVRRTEGVPIQIRVGVNSGEVVVRSIGSDLHMDYTAVGQTTHLAARMEQMAMPGSILISADTMSLAEGYLQVKPLGPLPVKGLEVPIEVYEIIGAALVRSRMEAAAARGLTRFVGREVELEALRQPLERAHAGHGQVVAVVGEPGVGKSRLFWEFIHSHRTHGWLVLESSSASYGQATPYLPVIDLLKALSFAKTLSGGQAVDLSALIRRQSLSMISTLLHLLRLCPFLCGGHRQLALENLALRHQLAVYKRTATRPKLRMTDRLFWVWLARAWAGWRQSLVIVTPDTVLRWQRRRFREHWTTLSGRPTVGRPPVNAEIKALVTRMAAANPLWGAPRIHGELLKLGIDVAERTVSRLIPKRPSPPSQTWRAFLTNHVRDLVAVDFFTVPTAHLRVLFVLVVLAHRRRRVLHFNVTEHPTAAWTAQQLVDTFPDDTAPAYLLRDRDQVYGHAFRHRVRGMGICEVLTAPSSPWQNPFAERLIGSIRRECLDHVLVLSERHLRRILTRYFTYYHRARTHLALEKDAPCVRPTEPPELGTVVQIPEVGGLHHRYIRRAA